MLYVLIAIGAVISISLAVCFEYFLCPKCKHCGKRFTYEWDSRQGYCVRCEKFFELDN